jgi:superfamily II DNA/RNA helicase
MNREEVCDKFLDALRFDPYPFQEEALLAWYESEGGVLVSAPTGMGKTLIAESAIFEALLTGKRMFYTTPLIALTDQKYREFVDAAERWGFSRDQVGLITGNRKENPDAPVLIVVAEILLNHLLAADPRIDETSAVVMDEFHYFNDWERGIVWELSLVLLPKHVRLMLLSATVGNAREFVRWMKTEHDRDVRLVQTDERRVPLDYVWVGDKLITEQAVSMVSEDDETNRTPALVFCFNRDECWDVAEKLKGQAFINQETRGKIEEQLPADDFVEGAGPKLRQLLIRGVAIHHAGVLPKHKEVIEHLFVQKLLPFVVCTETLAAGINLPARSVVISSLVKGKRGDKKLLAPAAAHQIFGRAGRPQFDDKGYVFAMCHEDDAKIEKWRKKYEQIDPNSKDPGIMKARKAMERKRPKRRNTEQYWTEGQFESLIKAGPGKLLSRSMIPYQVLIYLLTKHDTLEGARSFIDKRFNDQPILDKFQQQLDFMVQNLHKLGYVTVDEESGVVGLTDRIRELTMFRSVDPLYGAYLANQLVRSNFDEKLLALESVLPVPPVIERHVRIPDVEKGPLQAEVLEPLMIQMGVRLEKPERAPRPETLAERYEQEEELLEEEWPPTFPEMLKIAFESGLAAPEDFFVQPKWVAGAAFDLECDFYKLVRSFNLVKQEGLILRHLLRLVILAGEFLTRTEDPEYKRISELATETCRRVDERYTDRFLQHAAENKKLDELTIQF